MAVLLAEGYNATGVYRDYLGPIMERGVWSHAAYQSPLGEQPVGGRSNQHQFAEATLAAVAELYAGKALAAGDTLGECAAPPPAGAGSPRSPLIPPPILSHQAPASCSVLRGCTPRACGGGCAPTAPSRF